MQDLVNVFDGRKVRVFLIKREPWWVLRDVCEVLGLQSPHKVAERLDADERKQIPVIDSLGRSQDTEIINESGLYSVILRSDKPEAKRFKKWITSEVLPQIRKTGRYDISDEARTRSKRVRSHFTDALHDHGCDAPIHYIKITGTMKKAAGINGHKPKDQMDQIELAKVEAAEVLAAINLMQSEADGYDDCKPICREAAEVVAIATDPRKAIA